MALVVAFLPGISPSAAAGAPSAVGAGPSADPSAVIAGDIACDPGDVNFSGANPATCQMRATARQIADLRPSHLFVLGDSQYSNDAVQGEQPTLDMYRRGYGASWGATKSQLPGLAVRPAPGNHEYGDVGGSARVPLNASNYFAYFAGDLPADVGPNKSWYSYDVPVGSTSWHIVALDSQCSAIGGCGIGSRQERWLRSDLAANRGKCIAAYWHEPLFSAGGEGDNRQMAGLWSDLVGAGAVAVFNGHSHSYEHFGPQDAAGNATAGGMSEFVVGTGGADVQGFRTTKPNTVFRQSSSFGVLNLTMRASMMEHRFVTTSGAVMDSGTRSCGGGPPPGAPSVGQVVPSTGPSTGATQVVIRGTGFTAASAVLFGGKPAAFVVDSATQITATAPPGDPGVSTVDVAVTTAAGVSPTVAADQYTYTFATNGYGVSLSASTVSPPGGGSVTLTATANQDVYPTPYGISIMDETTGAEIAHVGYGTTLTTRVTQYEATTRRYVALISNFDGANPQAGSGPQVVTWPTPPRPTVTGISPSRGPAAGGTSVTISGTGFGGASAVSFGSAAATSFTVDSPTRITAVAPPAASGTSTAEVQVTTSGGTSAAGLATTFTYERPPVFTSSDPPATGAVGTAYGPFAFTASGSPPPTFSVASGALPPGLSLSADGVLSGTPDTSGRFTFTVGAANGVSPSAVTPARTIDVIATGSLYTPVTPARLLDTRTGTGGISRPLGPGETRELVVTGAVVPADAKAVVLNVTVASAGGDGYLTVFPSGLARPLASNLNFARGETVANLVTSGIGAGGRVSLYNDTGANEVIADVVGYYREQAGAGFSAVAPTRLLDSRTGAGGSNRPWGAAETRELAVTGSVVPADATAVVMNLTVTQPTAVSFLTVFPSGVTRPLASNLNVVPGLTVPNLVVVGVGQAGRISIYNDSGTAHVIGDVVGYYRPGSGSRFTAVAPTRLLDTRTVQALGPGETRDLVVRGGGTPVPQTARAVVLNVTATQPDVGGYVTVFPSGTPRPLASNLNFGPGKTIPNLVVAAPGVGGPGADRISLYNDTGRVHLIADVVGYMG